VLLFDGWVGEVLDGSHVQGRNACFFFFFLAETGGLIGTVTLYRTLFSSATLKGGVWLRLVALSLDTKGREFGKVMNLK